MLFTKYCGKGDFWTLPQTLNSVLSAGSKNQKKYVLNTGTSLYASGIWYLAHNKVLDIVWRQIISIKLKTLGSHEGATVLNEL